jgi:D-alanyl-D-alanine carboxypeptidase
MKHKLSQRLFSIALFIIIFTVSFFNMPESASAAASWPEAPEVNAQNAILIDADTGAILYEKNAYDRCYPASTTKILTGLLTVENCSMDDIVTFSSAAANSVSWEDANLATKAGEEYTVEQALYGLLLYSANEIAYGLAEHVGGTLENFVEMMNERAKELGAVDTHFANASGLFNKNHYTTAYDMAMIARGCYNNSTFVNIDSTDTTYSIGPTNMTSTTRTFRHRHLMLKGRDFYYEYCKGGKTGYTDEAGYTLVTFAEKDDMRLICVVFNCTDSNVRFTDTRTLFDWGFNNFKKVTVSSDTISSYFSGSNYYQTPVFSAYKQTFNLSASTLTIPNDASVSDISLQVDSNYAPTSENGVYTTNIDFKYGDNVVAASLLTFSEGNPQTDSRLPYIDTFVSDDSPKQKWCLSINIWFVTLAVSIIVILLCLISNIRRAHHRKNRRRRRRY